MASVTVSVPDNLVVLLGRALAQAMGEVEPTTNAQRADLAQRFMKQRAKEALLDYRAQIASEQSRSDDSDGAASW
jgi:hypothetical protein